MTDDAIRELFGQVPYFVDQKIEKYVPLDGIAQQFVATSYWSDQASVNLGDVCGTMHPDYGGMTWRGFLSKGRRMAGNLGAFRRNPGYYTDAEASRLPSMHFLRRDGKTFVGEDGNHRTCIGKCHLYSTGHAYIHRVCLAENVVDWLFYDLFLRLSVVKGASWRIAAHREGVRREDGPGWNRDFYETRIHISDCARQTQWSWDRMQLAEHLPELEYISMKQAQKGWFRKMFS